MGSRACDENKFDALLRYILNKEDAYTVLIGDMVDAVVRQDLKRFMGKCTTDDILNALDEALNIQRDMYIKKFKPLADAGKIIFVGEGNHEYEIKRNHSFDITRDVCKELGVPYGGYATFCNLFLQRGKGNTSRLLRIFSHHGFGSSRRTGMALNKIEQLVINHKADIYIIGHSHKKVASKEVKVYVTETMNPVLKYKPMIFASAGTFLKTYLQGSTTYSEKAGHPPVPLGVVKIIVSLDGNKEFNIHVSE